MENKVIFCSREQADIEHTMVADGNNELVATCTSCGAFLKFPIGSGLDDLILAHKAANEGQVVLGVYEVERVLETPADKMTEYDKRVLFKNQDILSKEQKETHAAAIEAIGKKADPEVK